MFVKLLSLLALGVGVFILVQLLLPLVAYKTWEVQAVDAASILVSPSSQESLLGVQVQSVGDFPAFVSSLSSGNLPFSQFTLSVPSLNLSNITVRVASNDFTDTPSQLPGTALPGEKGNVFITGHSSLPQVTKSLKIKPIFSKLPNIKKGADIFVRSGGQEFHYVVEGIKIVNPKEVGVINPPDSLGRYLSLMTCVPPGYNTKRLIVLSKLKT